MDRREIRPREVLGRQREQGTSGALLRLDLLYLMGIILPTDREHYGCSRQLPDRGFRLGESRLLLSGGRRPMTETITSELVVAYSQCPRKAYFICKGEGGDPHALVEI